MVAVTNGSNFVLSGLAFPGVPYDVHTLSTQLCQVERITGTKPQEVFVDRAYRGHGVTYSQVFIFGQKRGVIARLKRLIKQRQATEPVIGPLKNDELLGRNYLKGTEGDQMNAILSCAGHNMQIIMKKIRIICADFLRRLFSRLGPDKKCHFLLSGNIVNLPEKSLKQVFQGRLIILVSLFTNLKVHKKLQIVFNQNE